MPRPIRLWAAVLFVLALVVVGCGSDDDPASNGDAPANGDVSANDEDGNGAASELSGEITVSAAASLTDAYTDIGVDFEEANPGATVTLNFDSSGTLSDQILSGAPVDVFASADELNMDKLTDEDHIDGEPTIFARNHLAIVTQPGNPEGVETLEDLAEIDVVSLCGEDVPCGNFAGEILDGAGVEIPDGNITRGQNVRATLSAVADGDAVAGIVFVTDALIAGDTVEEVDIPEDQNAVAQYPIGVVDDAANPELAQAFVGYVTSDESQAVLEEYGFLAPT
jgi:molybdate transport system substrate-binding protein